MNKSPLPKVLLSILAVLAIWSLVLCWIYFRRVKQVHDMQVKIAVMSSRQQLFTMLVNDAAEYAKSHPAMEQLLRSIATGPNALNPAATPPPAVAKPPAK